MRLMGSMGPWRPMGIWGAIGLWGRMGLWGPNAKKEMSEAEIQC